MEIDNSKEAFLKNEFLTMSVLGALGRSKTYSKSVSDQDKSLFLIALREKLREICGDGDALKLFNSQRAVWHDNRGAMPRSARLDTAGVLHHIIIRGIERRNIFRENQDRENLLEQLRRLLLETKGVPIHQ